MLSDAAHEAVYAAFVEEVEAEDEARGGPVDRPARVTRGPVTVSDRADDDQRGAA